MMNVDPFCVTIALIKSQKPCSLNRVVEKRVKIYKLVEHGQRVRETHNIGHTTNIGHK
jgi:hypothetical protein